MRKRLKKGKEIRGYIFIRCYETWSNKARNGCRVYKDNEFVTFVEASTYAEAERFFFEGNE